MDDALPFDPRRLNDFFGPKSGHVPTYEPFSVGSVAGLTPMAQPQLTPTPGFKFRLPAGIGNNIDTLSLALGGLQTLGGLWAAKKQLGLAKKQFRFSRDFANANLENQTQSYNTAIADRARARGFTEGQSQPLVDDYIARNSLKQRTIR